MSKDEEWLNVLRDDLMSCHYVVLMHEWEFRKNPTRDKLSMLEWGKKWLMRADRAYQKQLIKMYGERPKTPPVMTPPQKPDLTIVN